MALILFVINVEQLKPEGVFIKMLSMRIKPPRIDSRELKHLKYYGIHKRPMIMATIEHRWKIFKYCSKFLKGNALTEVSVVNGLVPENHSLMVIGSNGTGKTNYIKNSLFDIPATGRSVVVVGSDFSVVREYEGWFQGKGYLTKVFDLVDMQTSDQWNPLQMLNISEIGDIAKAIGYLSGIYNRGDEISASVGTLILKCLLTYIVGEIHPDYINMNTLYTMSQNGCKELHAIFCTFVEEHPVKMMFNSIENAHTSLVPNLFTAISNALSILSEPLVRGLTSPSDPNDSIDLRLVGKKKCAYFCVVPCIGESLNILSGLYVYMVLHELCKTVTKNEYTPPIPVDIILDDLRYLPVIPNFVKIMNFLTHKGVKFTLTTPSIYTISEKYPNEWESILVNCGKWVFIEKPNLLTNEYIKMLQFGKIHYMRQFPYYREHPLAKEISNIKREQMPWAVKIASAPSIYNNF